MILKIRFILIILLVVFILLFVSSGWLCGAIPAGERAALINLYNASNGDYWNNNSGWKGNNNEPDGFSQVGSEGSWFGITVIGDSVTTINLRDNNLSGSIPSILKDLTNLKDLDLSWNSLSGTIPAELGGLGKLQTLRLSWNNLTGVIPAELGALSNLTVLQIIDNDLTGDIPLELTDLSNLTVLALTKNSLTGTVPVGLQTLGNLQMLDLFGNNLTGGIPPGLGNLSKLEYLDLGYNNLGGTIPVELGNLANLQYFYINNSNLSGTIPPELGNLTNLKYLYLIGNNLTGNIPPELGNLSKLIGINLGLNGLTGNIPPELGNISGLQHIYLFNNQLSGDIPAIIGTLANLKTLMLPNNNLSGTIPPGLGNLANLEHLELKFNHLSGAIPPGLGNLTKLQKLLLRSNKFSGAIPTGLINLTSLTSTDIGYNALYTDDTGLLAFLGGKDPDWADTQTIAPTGVSAAKTSLSSITVSWDPILYTSGSGGYKVFYSTTSGGPWTEAGTAAGKSSSQYEAAGLSMGTVYYFVVQTWTDAYYLNNNTVVSEYSDEVSASITQLPATYLLTVQSAPANNIGIIVSPADIYGRGNGNTPFTRTYDEGTAVSLTAPAEHDEKVFSNWNLDGVSNPSRVIQVSMNANHSVTAVYKDDDPPPPPGEYTLTVESTTGKGAAITVTPIDNHGNGNGTTPFTRTYDEGTAVNLTAPAEHNEKAFSNWNVDGKIKSNSQTVQITISGNHKAKAYYTTPSRPGLVLSRGKINFGHITGIQPPLPRTLRVTFNGGSLDWTAAADVSWLTLSPASGYGSSEVTVSVNPDGLAEGKYDGIIMVTAPGADNSPQTVKVTLNVYGSGSTTGPIGDFSTPIHGSVVSGSVPVTGWVVDDMGVESVKIFREGKNNKDLIYIGDAIFVEGARPDVAELYPDYPGNYQAGWGYMLLTNFFPGEGNGTFTLHAIAADVEGNTVTLGTRIIICDNANAVKPFGAMDTPTQGGAASGSGFINWGWVLTPMPNVIPTDGSTINVFVDGVKIGSPTYNNYRADIAGLFPGYANSNGAIGYFYLDTTAYENGVHTIQWTAADSAGNTDGIGSRYFTIQNSGPSRTHSKPAVESTRDNIWFDASEIDTLPDTHSGPFRVETKELQPVKIRILSASTGVDTGCVNPDTGGDPDTGQIIAGYMVCSHRRYPLPIGSTVTDGCFLWGPGPGFFGTYRLVFVVKHRSGRLNKREIEITIRPH